MLRLTGECQPHTLREFVVRYYPELLEAAESGCAVLTELQNTLAELLPLSQKLLPRDINQLTDIETQANSVATGVSATSQVQLRGKGCRTNSCLPTA